MRFLTHAWIWDWCRENSFRLEEPEGPVAPRLVDDPTLVHHEWPLHSVTGMPQEARVLAERHAHRPGGPAVPNARQKSDRRILRSPDHRHHRELRELSASDRRVWIIVGVDRSTSAMWMTLEQEFTGYHTASHFVVFVNDRPAVEPLTVRVPRHGP